MCHRHVSLFCRTTGESKRPESRRGGRSYGRSERAHGRLLCHGHFFFFFFVEQRAKASAEKAAEEAGLTVEARERMVNELLFTPSLEEITQHALTVARDRGKHQTNKDNVQTPEGFFIGTWSDRLHILYTEAIASDQGIREFPAFYDAGLNTFAKRRESLEKLVQKYRVVRHPSDFHRNYRIAQEYFEPILIQMCARPNSERGKLKEAELEAFADALRLSHTLCPGSWRGLSELIRYVYTRRHSVFVVSSGETPE